MKVSVETQWLNKNLYDKDLIIIDFSWYLDKKKGNCYKEYQKAHIPGSQFIDIDNISDTMSKLPHMLPNNNKFENIMRLCGVNNNSKVVIYDSQGIWSSPRLWWMLKYFGFKKVYILNGGLIKWKKEGRILTKKKVKKKYGDFKVKIFYKYLSTKKDIIKNIQTKKNIVIDVRSELRFKGLEKEPRNNVKTGHIENSKNIYWKKLINTNLTLKSNKKIKEILNKKNIKKKEYIISTCGSGITACILNIALAKLNFSNISVYDGSWAEWGLKK